MCVPLYVAVHVDSAVVFGATCMNPYVHVCVCVFVCVQDANYAHVETRS